MKTTITLKYAHGHTQLFPDEASALRFVERQGWTACEDWQTNSPETEHLLLWESEEASIDDDGRKAIAMLIRPNADAQWDAEIEQDVESGAMDRAFVRLQEEA